jgi:TonB family protein
MHRIALYCFVLASCVSVCSQENTGAAAAAEAPPPKRIRVAAGVLVGLLEHGVKPAYPEQAVRTGVKGDVILQMQVDETGKVVRTSVVEGDPLLVAASNEALQGFKFRPFLLNGNPLSVESQIEFNFAIKGKGDKAQGSADYTFNVAYRPEFRTGSVLQNGVLILSPRKISGPDPVLLPELAGKTGSVYLAVTIGVDGRVADVKIVGGDSAFAEPVAAAVRQDVFEPELIDGKPTVAVVQESFHLGPGRN